TVRLLGSERVLAARLSQTISAFARRQGRSFHLRGRPSSKPSGRLLAKPDAPALPKRQYGQRWQGETVINMVKRLLDAALRARCYWSQSREIFLRVLALNLMILRRSALFYRAGPTLFLSPFLSVGHHNAANGAGNEPAMRLPWDEHQAVNEAQR